MTTPSPAYIVLDASFVVALCSKEPTRVAQAETYLLLCAAAGCQFFAPGTCVRETLRILCEKLKRNAITQIEHQEAIEAFIDLAQAITPFSQGDFVLIRRAEQLRSPHGCSTSADAIYAAMAEELAKNGATEIITCDQGMQARLTNAVRPVSVKVIT